MAAPDFFNRDYNVEPGGHRLQMQALLSKPVKNALCNKQDKDCLRWLFKIFELQLHTIKYSVRIILQPLARVYVTTLIAQI